ncbi:MAG: universal stress protein [Galbitalea sp.]
MTASTSPATQGATDTGNWTINRIVVGVDGSPSSLDALRHAKQLAGLSGASVTAIISWQPLYNYSPVVPPVEWSPEDDAREVLESALSAVFGAERPASLVAQAHLGNPTVILLDASKSADLLVVGSRGLGGFRGLLLGSVSSACAEHASCPVLVVHGAPEA